MKKKWLSGYKWISLTLAVALLVTGCGTPSQKQDDAEAAAVISSPAASSAGFDLSFSARDLDVGYDEATATKITLSGTTIEVLGEGAAADGGTITISQEGTYLLTGALSDGQVIVDAPDTDKVQLVFNGVDIHNEDHAALYLKEADKVFITLASNSENTLSDGAAYVQMDEENVDGVIFSKADITINGDGSLNVNGNCKHGIVSKDDLIITGGKISVTSQGQGLYGKDCVKIKAGTFSLNTQGDAVQSDNAEDTVRGFVYIAGGMFTIDTQGDAFQAETLLQTDGGTFNVTTGGGSVNASTDSVGNEGKKWGIWGDPRGQAEGAASADEGQETASAKGLKAGNEMILNGGSFDIDSSDDALHSNGTLIITGGTYGISSGDDGLHADSDLTISGGIIRIEKSYEGIEGNTISIAGGIIELTARDDGLNVAGGNDGSAFGRPGQNNFANAKTDQNLRISGGEVKINASGDGLDSNGNLIIEGGKVTVSGPVNNGNGTLDYGGTATITGGILMATGSSGMAQGFSQESSQSSLLHILSTVMAAGTKVTLADSSGKVILEWTADKDFNSVQLSSPELVQGSTYTLTAGSASETITLSSVSTSNGGGMGGMGGGRGNMGGGQGGIGGGQGGMGGNSGGQPPQPGGKTSRP